MNRIAIIGSGFSGLSAACYLSGKNKVDVFEKNAVAGGRARQLKTAGGYTFDMGPSWYWMPDVFEDFFADLGYRVSDFYNLKLLDPGFEIVFENGKSMQVPADFEHLTTLFEKLEAGSGDKLRSFISDAKYKYEVGMKKLVHKPGLSLFEFMDWETISGAVRLQVFSSFAKHVRKYFSHPWLISLMEFPVLFLGAMPEDTPALYSLMNYAGLSQGTWYPVGGFGSVVSAMVQVAENNGASFFFDTTVDQIVIAGEKATGVIANGRFLPYDAVIAAADYHHVEMDLLPAEIRNYDEQYWNRKILSPSCLIFYVGVNKKIKKLQHHTLFFETGLQLHAEQIYKTPQWPSQPLFYACCTSKSDPYVAPEGHENLFLLMPIAPGLEDSEASRERYFFEMIARLEKHAGEEILRHIDFKKSYCVSDFVEDYNSYKGNAYGLANTLRQTANLKPKIKNKKADNLFYAGQLTVPGPGVPPSLVSGKIAAKQLEKYFKKTQRHETAIR